MLSEERNGLHPAALSILLALSPFLLLFSFFLFSFFFSFPFSVIQFLSQPISLSLSLSLSLSSFGAKRRVLLARSTDGARH